MRVLLTNWCYDTPDGSQTWVYTAAKAMADAGHTPLVWSDRLGLIAQRTAPFAQCAKDIEQLRPWDVVWGSHRIAARARGNAPCCQIIHATQNQDQEAPIPGMDAHFAVSEEVEAFLLERGFRCEGVVRQPIDVERFRLTSPIRPWPPRVLWLGNYHRWVPEAKEACRRLRLPFKVCGGPASNRRWDVAAAINEADLVVGQSRCVLEAMSCGRNAVVCSGWDPALGYGLDGLVYPSNWELLRSTNWTGRSLRRMPTVEGIIEEIRRYSPRLGGIVMRLVHGENRAMIALKPLLDWSRRVGAPA